MTEGFQRTLEQLRSRADSEAHKGRLFERLMQQYFRQDPMYVDQFSAVWRWTEWARGRPGLTGQDTGVDLVAEEHAGGCCAIQCKFHAPGTRITKTALDSFISASPATPSPDAWSLIPGPGGGPTPGRPSKG